MGSSGLQHCTKHEQSSSHVSSVARDVRCVEGLRVMRTTLLREACSFQTSIKRWPLTIFLQMRLYIGRKVTSAVQCLTIIRGATYVRTLAQDDDRLPHDGVGRTGLPGYSPFFANSSTLQAAPRRQRTDAASSLLRRPSLVYDTSRSESDLTRDNPSRNASFADGAAGQRAPRPSVVTPMGKQRYCCRRRGIRHILSQSSLIAMLI